jgi:hypothetical protein
MCQLRPPDTACTDRPAEVVDASSQFVGGGRRSGDGAWDSNGSSVHPDRNGGGPLAQIAPLRLELAPGKVIQTFAYNDRVPDGT